VEVRNFYLLHASDN